MTGVIAMIYGGESQVFSGFWGSSDASEQSVALALCYDAGTPYAVGCGATGNSTYGNINFRVSSQRATVWTRQVGTPGFVESVGGEAIALDTSYNSLIAIDHTDATDSDQRKCLTVKLGTDGTVTWQRSLRYDTTGGAYAIAPSCITTDSSDNVYVAGAFLSGGFVAKYNSSGTLQWLRTLSSDEEVRMDSVAIDAAGNVIVAGVYKFSGADAYAHITKYNSSGTLQWQKYISDISGTFATSLGAPAIVCDSSSNIYFYVSLDSTTDYDYYIKLNSSGAMQWTRRLAGIGLGSSTKAGAYVDADGYIYFCTQRVSGSQYIAKYDSSGTRQFDKSFSNIIGGNGIIVDTYGFMWTLGSATGGVFSDPYYSLTRVPSDGVADYTFTIPTEGNTITSSTPGLSQDTTALTIGTSSLTDAAGSTYTDSAGALSTSTPSLTSYVSTG